jgi:hypothetical protein
MSTPIMKTLLYVLSAAFSLWLLASVAMLLAIREDAKACEPPPGANLPHVHKLT